LYRQLKPLFSLSVDKSLGVALALDRVYNIYGQVAAETKANYVRIRVDTLSNTNITDCVAFIKSLSKRSLQGSFTTIIDLPQSILIGDGTPFTIYHHVPKMIDILKCQEENNRIIILGYWPAIMQNTFVDDGIYTFEICVNAGELSKMQKIEVTWTGRWDKITARDVI